MKSRLLSAAGIATLILSCLLPVFLLLDVSLASLHVQPVEICRLLDGRIFFGIVLDRSGWDRRTNSVRILRGDDKPGVIAISVPERMLVSHSPAPEAWIVEREDGPDLFGEFRYIEIPGRRILARDTIDDLVDQLPAQLRQDRSRLACQIRKTTDRAAFDRLGEDWQRWLVRDDSTRLGLSTADGRILSIRISGIARATPPGKRSATLRMLAGTERLWRFLSTPPGPWGGGGIRPAILSLLQLSLFAGLFAGVFGLSAAFWMQSRGRVGGGRRPGRALISHLASVPGVVWGVAGSGLLIHGIGAAMDRLWVSPNQGVVWGAGGLLWSSLTLGAFATPIVLALALDELDRIPERWIEILWSSGATEFQVLRRIVLPRAWKGLVAAVLSGMARAAGETAPLLLMGAVHSAGGLLLGGIGLFPGLSGGFLHPGVLALDPPWQGADAELGQPLVALALLCLSIFCIAIDLVASRLRHRRPRDLEIVA